MLWILFSNAHENKFLYTYLRKFFFFEKVNKLIFFKSHDYFQNMKINVIFLLNNFLFYMKNIVQCLHHTRY
jgi:hypothetical protein